MTLIEELLLQAASTSRWTMKQLDDLKGELNLRYTLDPFWLVCADAVGSLQFDLIDAQRHAATAADRIEELETENGELQEWRTALHGSVVEAEERVAKASARIEELEKRFLARTGQSVKEET